LSIISRSDFLLVGGATVIIVFAIVITATVQGQSGQAFSQVITAGPIWSTDAWSCTSDADFMIHGALRANGPTNQISISMPTMGTQSLYALDQQKLETFSIGSPGGTVIITRTGQITGFITLQTASDATASCMPV